MRLLPFVLFAALFAGCSPQTGSPVDGEDARAKKGPTQSGHVALTPAAAAKVKEIIRDLIKEGKPHPLFLRVRVVDDEYKLDLDPDTDREQDQFSESRGVRIVVDRASASLMASGTVVDYSDGDGQTGFKVIPPSADPGPPDEKITLADARRGFKTSLTRQNAPGAAPVKPPAGVFDLVQYDSPAGKLHAYLTAEPKDGKKHPAIVWITGGDCNTIDQGCWREGAGGNDQSASAYRKAGVVMMFPSQRGGNDNPGPKEAFLGEVEDIVAAAEYLARQPFVDPERFYLGGHSTGGTLALLVSEYTGRFRAVFSFGPVEDIRGYGLKDCPFSLTDPKEIRLRAPGLWLHSIRSPTFVIEGTAGGNMSALRTMAKANKNPKCHFLEAAGADHFNLLGPLNGLIAAKVLADTGPACAITLTPEEVNKPFKK